MSEFPDFTEFPEGSTDLPNVNVVGPIVVGVGAMTSQSGEDLYRINLDIFVGPTPTDGIVRVQTDAAGAREFAAHLLQLADAAEFGVEAR